MTTNNRLNLNELDKVAGGKRKYAPSGLVSAGNDVLKADGIWGNDIIQINKAEVDPKFDPINPHA